MPQPPQAELQNVAENLYRNASSKTYYVLVKIGGKQIRKSLRTTDRQLANRRKKDLIEKLKSAELSNLTSGILFESIASKWLDSQRAHQKLSSYRRRETCVAQLEKHFKGLQLRKIGKRQCELWANIRAQQVAASTYNKEMETLSLIFGYAIEHGYIVESPTKVLKRRKKPKPEILIPSHKQFETLVKTLKSLDIRYYSASILVELLAYSGMRLGEANSLLWGDIDFDAKRFTVTGGINSTKNHEVRVVPLFPKLESFFNSLRGEIPTDATASVSPIKDAKKALAKVCELNGFPRFTHHTMRHYFCSNAIEKGIDFKTIAAWLGHKDGGVLVAQTYGHLRDTHSFEMAKLMK